MDLREGGICCGGGIGWYVIWASRSSSGSIVWVDGVCEVLAVSGHRRFPGLRSWAGCAEGRSGAWGAVA